MTTPTETLKDLIAWNCAIDGTLPEVGFRAGVTCYRVPAKNETAATARAGAAAAAIFRSGHFVPDDGSALRSEEDTRPPLPKGEDDDALPPHEVTLTIEHRKLQASAVVKAYDVRAVDAMAAIASAAALLGKQLSKVADVRVLSATARQTAGPLQPRLPLGSQARPADVDEHGVVDEAKAPPAEGGGDAARVERVMDEVERRAPEIERKLKKLAHGGISSVSVRVTRGGARGAKKGARR